MGEKEAAVLKNLVFEYLERRESEGDSALRAICEAHPEHANALHERVLALRDAGLIDEADQRNSRSFPEKLGDYRLLERLGGGGMGIVYLAEQVSIVRRVALKLVRPEHLYFPDARERFQREVEAVARLAHPNIVPIYAVGEEDGLPYFAMEHVAGASLAEILVALRGRDPASLRGSHLAELLAVRSPGSGETSDAAAIFAGTWVEACLLIAREVALALEHAHRRGVLHRDIKPSNIMLTPSGRVLLLDFGLANLAGASRLTHTGAQLGSLPYMPPERIRGERSEADARGDVYALGVTLYELLTLSLPYFSESSLELIQRVLDARPSGVQRRNHAVPTDAAVVCGAAMDADPSRRYATAEALASDISNVLELRPIRARPAGPWLRARRWAQRHPARAVAAGLGIVVTVGGPLVFGFQQRAAAREQVELNRQLVAANSIADAEKAHAIQRFEDVRRLAKTLMFDIHDDVQKIPGTSAVRRKIVDVSLAYLRGLELDARDDAVLAFEIAQGYEFAGNALGNPARPNLGDPEGALASYRSALALFERLVEREPQNVEYRRYVAWMHVYVAAVLGFRFELAAAREETRLAVTLARELSSTTPTDPQTSRLAVQALVDDGALAERLGERDAAFALRQEALAAAQGWQASAPQDEGANAAHRHASGALAGSFAAQGRLGEAVALLEEVLATHQRRAAQAPDQFGLRYDEIGMRNELGRFRMADRDVAGAITDYREAVRIADEFVQADADDFGAGIELASSRVSLAAALVQQGDARAAIAEYEASLGAAGAVVAKQPASREARGQLALAHERIGELGEGQIDAETALGHLRQSLAVRARLADEAPDDVKARAMCATNYYLIGKQELRLAAAADSTSEDADEHRQLALAAFNDSKGVVEALVASGGEHARYAKQLNTLAALIEQCAALGAR